MSNGSWRPCGDLRRLNILTETDCYPSKEVLSSEMGAHSWFHVSALPRSRVSGILGTWARGITNFVQEPGNAEREIIGKLILHSFGEI